MLYKLGGLPGKGRREAPKSGDILDLTRAMASRFAALDKNDELARLRSCANSPKMKAQMIAAMQKRSAGSTNMILRECNISVPKLQQVADTVLGDNSRDASAINYRSDRANPPDVGPPVEDDSDQRRLSCGRYRQTGRGRLVRYRRINVGVVKCAGE
ncbi:hypothetical protein [Parasphingorhabdus sp.]|uniref:hypothetical protein n=1 Tax=Parasphingorhabdus sp. TaxID=2709688 RepID=UPI003A91F0DF